MHNKFSTLDFLTPTVAAYGTNEANGTNGKQEVDRRGEGALVIYGCREDLYIGG